MNKWKRAARIAITTMVALAAIVVILVGSLFIYLAQDLCASDIQSLIISPNGKFTAVVFQRDCGATTAFSIQVTIVPAGKKFPADGYPTFLVISGIQPPDLKWVTNSEIEVYLPEGVRIYKNDTKAGDISITYMKH